MNDNAVKNGQVLDMALYAYTRQDTQFPVRRLYPEEIQTALDLSWDVFLQFEAPEYSEEGVQEFRKSLDDKERTRKLQFYGAFDKDKLIGMLCMREPQHIGGFFVRAEYHRKGIGRDLFETMKKDYDKQQFTVNSSPYAVEIYKHLGFKETDVEQTVNGIRFTPMEYSQSIYRMNLTLESKRLYLYPISDDEMRLLIEKEKDAEMKQAYSEMLQGCLNSPEDRVWSAVWFMELKEQRGTIVGDFCFKGLGPDGMVEIGYGLREGYCKKGYMTEAVKTVSEWALSQERVTRVEAETTPDNTASEHVLRNAGFEATGEIGEEGPRFVYRGKGVSN